MSAYIGKINSGLREICLSNTLSCIESHVEARDRCTLSIKRAKSRDQDREAFFSVKAINHMIVDFHLVENKRKN